MPSRPTRGWRKKTGPRSESRIDDGDHQRTAAAAASSQHAATDPVHQVLEQPGRAGERRLLDVQQRQALDRPDVHPGAGDVGELRRHDQVDAGALELPGQPAQLARLGAGRAADRDGVGAELADQAITSRPAYTGTGVCDAARGGVALGEVDADRHQAGAGRPGDGGVDLERLGQRADQQHPVRARDRGRAQHDQHPPGQVPADQDVEQRRPSRAMPTVTRDR